MGLDNGICIKIYDNNAIKLFKKFGIYDSFYTFEDIEKQCEENRKHFEGKQRFPFIEPIYWRKCWGVRQRIIEEIAGIGADNGSCVDIDIDLNNIDKFIEIIKFFCNEDNWERYSNSIWSWCEGRYAIEKTHLQMISNIKSLMKYLEENNIEYYCYFYDSY